MSLLYIIAVFNQKQDSGVSPVIGVILMVAVTVALVALVTVTVFDIGGDVSDSPDATVEFDKDLNNDEVTATILRNENVDEIYLSADDTNSPWGQGAGNSAAGDTITATIGDADSGTINVIAVMPDGSEEVLTSTDYDFG